jgi:repressor LexA
VARTEQGRLTVKQLDFLDRLIRFQAREGVPPSVREMQAIGGFRSPRSVGQFLDALEAAGYVERAGGARNTRVLRRPPNELPDHADTVLIPVVGRVAAGRPILAAENVEEHLAVSTKLARRAAGHFLLRVRGDSMNRAGIKDGDLVLVRQQESADTGQVVVALIDDEATVKRFRRGRDAIVLEPASSNKSHRPIVVDGEFRIQGVVVASIPGFGSRA